MRVISTKNLKDQQVAIAITLFILLLRITTVLGVHDRAAGNCVMVSINSNRSDWWFNPCRKEHTQTRHARSPGTRQLNISINNINEMRKKLKKIYPNYKDPKTRSKCLKIKSLIDPVKKASDKLEATMAFYQSLTQLAMYMDKLRKKTVQHESSKFNNKERWDYYEKLKDNIRMTLCEASFDIGEQAPEHKNTLCAKKLSRKDLLCIPKNMDLSQAQMIDVDFLNKVFRFLKQARNQLRKLHRKRRLHVSQVSQRKKKRTKSLM